MTFDKNKLSHYPNDPGVYLMKNEEGAVLYIGKAKNLRARIKQYFAISGDQREMIPYLISQVHSIDTIVALSEKDALLLENQLIKKHQPKYNVMLKDDKTYISLLLTKHKWPTLQLVRNKGKSKKDGTYFGPYTNALAARQTHDLLLRLFPLRQCSDVELASRKRPCLLYDIKRCLAPCVGKCTHENYLEQVERAKRLLKGQDKEVIKDLKHKMHEASEKLEFEKANEYLQMIEQIEHVTTIQHVENPFAQDCDVVGLYREADAVMIALLLFREGKIVGSEHFSFHQIISSNAEILSSFLLQHYTKKPPSQILLFEEPDAKKALEEILQTAIQIPKIGKKKELIEMANRNAKALFTREEDARSLKEKRLLDLQESLQLNRYPRRIECVDTSNLAGSDPVASLVSFVHGEKDSSRMRLFKIRQTGGSDDYASMKEVLLRHFTRLKEKGDFPDLLILDGGKGQLNIALQVFETLQIATVDAIALTKEQGRHDKGMTQEKIYLPHQKEPLLINPRSPLLFLLQTIRDEAHRAAILFQKKQRSKKMTASALDELKGIGPIKKRRLLVEFKSVDAIKKASAEDLKKIKGLTKKDIEQILLWEKE